MNIDRKFKNIFLISFITAVSFILLNVYIVFPSFQEQLIREIESDSSLIAKHFSSMAFTEDGVVSPAQEFDVYFQKEQKLFNIEKIKVFSSDGTVVYSTDHTDIGSASSDLYFHEYVATGRLYSKMVKKDTKTAEGITSILDVVETYVPVMSGGHFLGAIEIYKNATDEVAALNRVILRSNIFSLLLFIIFFILIAVSVIRPADSDDAFKNIQLKKFYRNPYRLLLFVFITIFSVELGIMFLLRKLAINDPILEAFFDSSLLVFFAAPFFYMFMLQPLLKYISEKNKAEADLLRSRDNLAVMVNERTAELSDSVKSLDMEVAQRRKAEGMLRSIIETANDAIISTDADGNIRFFSRAAESIFGYSADEIIEKPVTILMPEPYRDLHTAGMKRLAATNEPKIIGRTIELEGLKKNGRIFPIELSLSMWEESDMKYYSAIIRDITKRVESEKLLKKSESKFKALFEHSTDSVIILRMFQDEARIIDLNPASLKMFRAGHDAMFNMSLAGISPLIQPGKEYSKDKMAALITSARRGEPQFFEWRYKRFDNTYFDAEVVLNSIFMDDELYLHAIIRDITDRKLMTMQMVMEKERAQTYFNIAGVILLALDDKGYVASINKKGLETLGYTREETIGKSWFDHFIPENLRREVKAIFFKLMGGEVSNTEYYENNVLCKDGSHRVIAWYNTLLKNNEGAVIGTLSSGEDITERKKSEESALIQFNRLKALHAMDMAITSSFDLNMILNIFLDNIILLMKADAAAVFLMHENSFMLEHVLSRGFTSPARKNDMVQLGDSLAGRAVIERKTMFIPDMSDIRINLSDSQRYKKEGFVTYIAVPLISKGNIKGVLEIFHRTRVEPDNDWFDFIKTLAAQAAIAIDDTAAFQELQDLNIELSTAYDSTLEVWAKTLELTDKEPAGHSERVIAMTLRIGKELGISDRDLINLKHGALLHDIGKLGTPDSILLKPGKLTEEEWDVIKTHTTMAHDLLYGIKQLRQVLSIPLYHHEKWDGTGYPKGLKGTQIPIGARVFAIVDVWDSLLSDRPYRAAWPREKILEHIRSESGRHFDPQVVEIFLGIV